MEPPTPGNPVSAREKAAEDLVRAHGFVNQLKFLLEDDQAGSAASKIDLADKILDSLDFPCSILASNYAYHVERSNHGGSRSTLPMRSLPSSNRLVGSKRSLSHTDKPTARFEKRNKRETERTWMLETCDPCADDGYAWRKYGQNDLLDAKYPRSYFRCAMKELCGARKQVQQIQDDPPKFLVEYFATHTCQNLFEMTGNLFIARAQQNPLIYSPELLGNPKPEVRDVESSLPKNPPFLRLKAAEWLEGARLLATQLKILFQYDHSESAASKQDLADEILDSTVFAWSILIRDAANYDICLEP